MLLRDDRFWWNFAPEHQISSEKFWNQTDSKWLFLQMCNSHIKKFTKNLRTGKFGETFFLLLLTFNFYGCRKVGKKLNNTSYLIIADVTKISHWPAKYKPNLWASWWRHQSSSLARDFARTRFNPIPFLDLQI